MAAPGEGFPKSARICRRADFDRVFSARSQVQGTYLRMHLAPGSGESARLGFAIARRAVPLAHDRNRLKRLLREAFRRMRSQLPALDIVFTVRERPPEDLKLLAAEAVALLTRLQQAGGPRLAQRVRTPRENANRTPKPSSELDP